MKKRLLSIALALAVTLAFASGAFAAVLPPTFPATDLAPATPAGPVIPAKPAAPTYPAGTVIPGTVMTPATPVSPAPTYPAGTVVPGTVMTPATPITPATPVTPSYPAGTTVIPATPLYPASYPPGTILPATPMYPAMPRVLKPNPLPRDAKPLPPPYATVPPYGYGPHSYDKAVTADVVEMINRLAVKYNANPKELYRYIFISDASFDRLDSKDQAALKKLMVKMAAKAMGISASKLEKELDDIEAELIARHMKRTSVKKAEARKYVREHAHNSLFYGAR